MDFFSVSYQHALYELLSINSLLVWLVDELIFLNQGVKMMWFCHMKLCCGKKVRTAFKYLLQQFESADRGNNCMFVIFLQLVTPDLSSSWDPWRTESTMIWSQNSQRSLDLVFHVSSSSRWLLHDGSKAVFVDHVCVLIRQIDFACLDSPLSFILTNG